MHNGTCWACGPQNGRGLKLTVVCDEKASESAASFFVDRCYAGNEGVAHGGVICSIFDSVMTHAAMARSGGRVFTAKLDVRFKKKIAVGDTITVRCRFEKMRFGFMVVTGEIRNGENKIAAKADALFAAQD